MKNKIVIEKLIKKSKLYLYAHNWIGKCYGKSSLNPTPLITKTLNIEIKELMEQIEEK